MKKEEEQLIKELEEQLAQYTYEDKEIDPEQLEKICKLLDVLKPQKAPEFNIEESFESFRELCKKRDEEEAKAASRRKVLRYRKIFMGIAASLFVVLTVNIGSYATKQKSFFDIMSEGKNGIGFLVTGNAVEETPSEEELLLDESNEQHYSSWEEVDEKTKEGILIPKAVPEGFELEDINVHEIEQQKVIKASYKNTKIDKNIVYEITSYDSIVSSTQLFLESNGELVKDVTYKNTNFKFYRYEEDIVCYFFEKNKLYRITSNLSVDKLQEAIIPIIL